MRTDLTVRTNTGTECDVAVFATPGTTWGAVAGLVCDAVPGAEPRWCGNRALTAGMIVGRAPMVTGAVLTSHRSTARRESTLRLEVVGGRDCNRRVAIGTAPLTIGRDPDCDLVLDDPRVSRRHVRVRTTSAGVTATDLASTDGMYEGGERVAATRLAHDSVVRIGTSYLAVTGVSGTTPQPATVAVPTPPEPPARSPRLPLLGTLLPAVLGAGLAMLTGSWEFLVFAALSPMAGLASAIGERRHDRRRGRRDLAQFRRDRARSEAERAEALRLEAAHRRDEHPHADALIRACRPARDAGDPDLLRVRIGLGALPSRLQPGCEVADVPVTIDLAAGPVAIVGPRDITGDVVRALLVQVAAVSSARDVTITIADHDNWTWARWLPHTRSTNARHVLAVGDVLPRDGATTAIVLVGNRADTPSGCATHVVVDDVAGRTVHACGPDGNSMTAIADRIDSARAEQLARALAGVACELPPRAELPVACHLSDLVGDNALSTRWARSDGSACATLGMSAAGPVTVDLDRDGPHVLVAGSTGAGKSELLQCLVTGLALQHPPSDVSFLLVDYKGGAAFGECARLPHTVGLVTDLDEQLTRRVLTALDSEIARRERLFAVAGASDLTSYRIAARSDPIARLVIVVDEFATLADELGSFVPSLVAIARRGRSLGLHLVLATQRPSGVVSPEIRANTALRICLRVNTATESIDVVDTAAAADFTQSTPGRAILRTGAGTRVFQTARVSAAGRDATDAPRVVRLGAWRQLPASTRLGAETDLERFVAQVRAAHHDNPLPHRPWLAPLPRALALAEIEVPEATAVGLVDLPAEQRQPTLTIDVEKSATVLVTGRAHSGRTTALHTIAHAAAARHAPQELHIYGIDATGNGLAPLRALPHTGTIATTAEGFDFTARLVDRLLTTTHRALLLIDGWDELLSASDDHDGGRTAERVTNLLRSTSHGHLTAVVTGGRATLAPRLTTLAPTRYLLGLNDDGEYAAAGVPAQCVPTAPPPGRALRVGDWAPVQFAIADRSGGVAGAPAADAIRMRPLPTSVPLAQLPPGTGTALGMYGDACKVARVDLVGTDARVLVAGPPRSGRTTVLRTILRQSSGCAVVAPPRSPLSAAARAGHRFVRTPDELPATGLLLVDDLDQIGDSALGDAIAAWTTCGEPGRAVVAAGRSDALALGYRGVVALLRAQSCGILLRPGVADAALLGVPVPTSRTPMPPGRGVLVPDPRWGLGDDPVPIQLATP